MNIVYNMDCMEGMKQYPDNYFDLAIVDPPYGAGLGEGGGGKGWFAKYWDSENHEVSGGVQNTKNRLPREELPADTIKERTRRRTGNGVTRTGGKWAAKFGKKSFRGMCRLNMNTLKNCFASHVIR